VSRQKLARLTPNKGEKIMSSFRANALQYVLIILVASVLLTLGSVAVFPEKPANAVTMDVAVEQAETAAIYGLPNEIADFQDLAQYQFRLSDTTFAYSQNNELVGIDQSPNQILDHQALAEYQSNLGNGRLAGQ
jgi:hypothetical protein